MSGFNARQRSAARMAAVQALYELDMVEGETDRVLRNFIEKRWSVPLEDEDGEETGEVAEFPDPDKSFLIGIVRGVLDKRDEIDTMLNGALGENWSVVRLEVLLRAVLRAGTFELMAHGEIPAKVVINEYMDVANAFFSGGEPKMVNGVLDKLGHVLRDGRMN